MSKTRNPTPPAGKLPTTWSRLTAMHPLRPIHDAVDLDNATEIIDRMAGHKLNGDQSDYLDSLSTLVEAYEAEHDPVTVNLRGIKALAALLDEHDMNASDLARLLGIHRSAGSKILKGERALTANHIGKLVEHFKIHAGLFVS